MLELDLTRVLLVTSPVCDIHGKKSGDSLFADGVLLTEQDDVL